ncbi:Hypothetical predicted protein [Cloeon dipterum]|uniref:PID domain-containing protein n=1 Tax=Cloeon dipterum TaxID=197152 RepID=A0A8S1DAR3_9INSE|nr:Hypothetical predicted protein [Cloeon dipterum]
MRNNSLLRWAQGNNKNNAQTKNGGGNSKAWIHPPDALLRGHIAYLVKFFGSTRVDQPKGIEVVKEGIRKLKFCEQLRKSEGGGPKGKVELTISVDGVAVQEPKGAKRILHQYPLHRISYCADDKGEKRFFSFIAKEADSDTHMCYVFISDKLAEDITLTIGQAFELAYRRFLETSGKDLASQHRIKTLEDRNSQLETENGELKRRLQDLVAIAPQGEVQEYLRRRQLADITETCASSASSLSASGGDEPMYVSSSGGSTSSSEGLKCPPVPPRAFERISDLMGPQMVAGALQPPQQPQPAVGTRLQGLLLDQDIDDFNPRAHEDSKNGNYTSTVPPPCK